MKTLSVILMMLSIGMVLFGCAPNAKESQMEEFIQAHVEKIKPMEKQVNLAYWNAANSGKETDYDKVSALTLEIRRIYSDPCDFAFIKEAKESEQVKKPLLTRQMDILYNAYLENQIESELLKQIVELGIDGPEDDESQPQCRQLDRPRHLPEQPDGTEPLA